MPSFFSNLTTNLWSFVSPRQTQKKREKPFKAPTTSSTIRADQQYGQGTMPGPSSRIPASPASITMRSKRFSTPSSSDLATSALGLGPFPTPGARSEDTDPMDVGEEAATYVRKSRKSKKSYRSSEDPPTPRSALSDVANDETLLQPSSEAYDDLEAMKVKQEEFERSLIKKRALAEEKVYSQGWSDEEVDFYVHLEMRGYEPLLPISWERDFNTLPEALFTDDEENAYIRTLGGPRRLSLGTCEFRAQKALQTLIGLGPRIREARIKETQLEGTPRKSPPEVARKEIEKYFKWALTDAGLDRKQDIEGLVVVETATKEDSATDMQEKMWQRLDALAERHLQLDSSRRVPALYGILLTRDIVAFSSLDPNKAVNQNAKDLRIIAILKFEDMDYDVWNSLAIAIMAMHTRGIMVQMYMEEESMESETDDPDV